MKVEVSMPKQSQTLTQNQNQRQHQRLLMLPQMQQAFLILQMPILELAVWLEEQMAINPLMVQEGSYEDDEFEREEEDEASNERDLALFEHLDREAHEFSGGEEEERDGDEARKRQAFAEQFVVAGTNLTEHLNAQAREVFAKKEDLLVAEAIIGNLNEEGFLQANLAEIASQCKSSLKRAQKVLAKIQEFDPIGIGATSIQECLLLQLKHQGKGESLAAQILTDYYEDFLHHRLSALQKKLRLPAELIERTIQEEIACLSLHPGTRLSSSEFAQQIVPDLFIWDEEGSWRIAVNEEPLPSFHVDTRYLRMLEDSSVSQETKEFILQKLRGVKWLWRTLSQRGETLAKIAEVIATRQREFLLTPLGRLRPLTMQEIAQELDLHESTIARTISGKYAETPKGLFSLRSLIGQGYASEMSDEAMASTAVRDLIRQLIRLENKKNPLSDAELAIKLRDHGVSCARRTVAKYRAELQLGNAQQRRLFCRG